jgi:hypothetical protein
MIDLSEQPKWTRFQIQQMYKELRESLASVCVETADDVIKNIVSTCFKYCPSVSYAEFALARIKYSPYAHAVPADKQSQSSVINSDMLLASHEAIYRSDLTAVNEIELNRLKERVKKRKRNGCKQSSLLPQYTEVQIQQYRSFCRANDVFQHDIMLSNKQLLIEFAVLYVWAEHLQRHRRNMQRI